MLKRRYMLRFQPPVGLEGRCAIWIYAHNGDTVVICTETKQNPGQSITNAAEYIATDVWHDEGFPPLERFIWIEHYQADSRRREAETFDRVTFTKELPSLRGPRHQQAYPCVLREPEWTRITQAEVEVLTGEPWTPIDV